jgi:chemotaxis protein MotB
LLQQDGVRSDQVTQVRGYADQLLRIKNNPYDPSNRRISILVKNEGTSQPTLDHGKVGNGAAAPSTGESKPANSGPDTRSAAGKPLSAPAAKPSFMARLKSYIPGKPNQQQR